jgi:hypothetical protein
VVVGCALAISQGNAWGQVVASRINRAVYDRLWERRAELQRAQDVIIDVSSFRQRVRSGWVQADFDFLNSYYGAQALEEWGLQGMVYLVTGTDLVRLHLAVDQPRAVDNSWRFTEGHGIGSRRRFTRQPATIPTDRTVLIDFDDVFGDTFGDGRRDK